MALRPENEARLGPYELEVREFINLVEQGIKTNLELDVLLDRGPTIEQNVAKQKLIEKLDAETSQKRGKSNDSSNHYPRKKPNRKKAK